jgi:hypothetical protein
MTYERLKQKVVSLALTALFILSVGLASNSRILARTDSFQGQGRWEQNRDRQWQNRDRQWQNRDRQWERRRREREELGRIRSLDREHQLRTA